LTPIYSYRYYTSKDNGNIKQKYKFYGADILKNILDTTEFPIFGYSIGLNYIYSKKRYNFSVGINYSKYGESTKATIRKAYYVDINGNQVLAVGGEETYYFKNYYHQINIPIAFSYLVYNKPLRIFVRLGPVFSYIIKSTVTKPSYYDELIFKPGLKKDHTNSNKYLFGVLAGIKFDKRINEKTHFGIEPIFNLQMTPTLTFEKELMQYNYYGGLRISLTRRIQ
jgi:hypothetical protein